MKKKQKIGMGLLAAVILVSGCQKSPENSIVKNKDLEKMVGQAREGENGVSDVADMAQYDTYQDNFSDESLGVTVNVDARVDIPAADQMSVVRIRQKEITQEFLDQVKEALMPETVLCDGSMVTVPTKSGIEQEIQEVKRYMEEAEAQLAAGEIDEESRDIMVEEYQQNIDDLKRQYEEAPVEIDGKDYPSDGRLHSVEELLSLNPQNAYYTWQGELNPEGSVFYGVGEGAEGYHSLYVQNNVSYGNCLVYKRSAVKYPDNGTVSVSSPLGNGYAPGDVWKTSEEPRLRVEGDYELKEMEEDTAQGTLEEAQRRADEFMQKLKLEDYDCYSGDLYSELCGTKEQTAVYRKVYVFQYLRNLEGVYVNNEGLSKLTDEWRGEEYVKKEWPGESVLVFVNDSGIVGFYYLAPIETVETVADKAKMKSFEEIKDIFKQMIIVTNASEEETKTIRIDRVTLRYTRISEADSFDTGLLVPVWDFEGAIESTFQKEPIRGSLLTINAIDGSVIDKQLGY